jgi:CRISPR-associated protein Cas2
MFVAIACDLGTAEHQDAVQRVLLQYGFKKAQEGLYESVSTGARQLLQLKNELDRVTDSYDSLRFYQYPLEGTLVVSSLQGKKWRKLICSPGEPADKER